MLFVNVFMMTYIWEAYDRFLVLKCIVNGQQPITNCLTFKRNLVPEGLLFERKSQDRKDLDSIQGSVDHISDLDAPSHMLKLYIR